MLHCQAFVGIDTVILCQSFAVTQFLPFCLSDSYRRLGKFSTDNLLQLIFIVGLISIFFFFFSQDKTYISYQNFGHHLRVLMLPINKCFICTYFNLKYFPLHLCTNNLDHVQRLYEQEYIFVILEIFILN